MAKRDELSIFSAVLAGVDRPWGPPLDSPFLPATPPLESRQGLSYPPPLYLRFRRSHLKLGCVLVLVLGSVGVNVPLESELECASGCYIGR
jgi:hypothetical protein